MEDRPLRRHQRGRAPRLRSIRALKLCSSWGVYSPHPRGATCGRGRKNRPAATAWPSGAKAHHVKEYSAVNMASCIRRLTSQVASVCHRKPRRPLAVAGQGDRSNRSRMLFQYLWIAAPLQVPNFGDMPFGRFGDGATSHLPSCATLTDASTIPSFILAEVTTDDRFTGGHHEAMFRPGSRNME
jgi:hypothetical protein